MSGQTDVNALADEIDQWVEALRHPNNAELTLVDIALLNGECVSEAIEKAAKALRRPAPTEPDIRAAAFEECARFIESGSGMADLIDQDDLDQQAKYIRSLALSSGEPDTNLQKMQIAPEGVTGEAVAFINVRLADLAEANALYDKDKRLNAPDKIARNDREISWLKDLRSIIVYASALPAARIGREEVRRVLAPFYKTVDVMKAARNNKSKVMHVWADDMKSVEDVMFFLENLRDSLTASAPAGGCADSRANR